MFSGTQALPENRGAYVRTQNWHVLSDRSDQCGQRPRNTIWTSPLDRSRRVDQDSYVECPNRSPDEGDMAYTRSACRAHQSDRYV
jgi:hypothetical protein